MFSRFLSQFLVIVFNTTRFGAKADAKIQAFLKPPKFFFAEMYTSSIILLFFSKIFFKKIFISRPKKQKNGLQTWGIET